jgi:hypothetical protein
MRRNISVPVFSGCLNLYTVVVIIIFNENRTAIANSLKLFVFDISIMV